MQRLVGEALSELQINDCITQDENGVIFSTEFGRIASYYYLKHKTIKLLKDCLGGNYSEEHDFSELLRILSNTLEYSELPVRHNEDIMNQALEQNLPVPLGQQSATSFSSKAHSSHPFPKDYESPHCKAFLLLQAHLERLDNLPCSDYITDTNSVLDQAIRILQAMIDICVVQRNLKTAAGVMKLVQCIRQARWPTDSSLTCLPHLSSDMVPNIKFKGRSIESLKELSQYSDNDLDLILSDFSTPAKTEISKILRTIPKYKIDTNIKNSIQKDGYWILDAAQKYEINIFLKRSVVKPQRTVYAPKFPKPVAEGLWVMFGKDDQVLELKRLSPSIKSTDMFCSFRIITPNEPGLYSYTVYFISDCYMGLDQRIDIRWRQ